MKRQIYRITILSTLIACLHSCSLDIPYDNQFSDPDAITSVGTARELLATAYNDLPNIEYDLSVLSDDFTPTSHLSQDASLNNTYKWQPSAFQDLSFSVWQGYYTVNTTLNALLERTPSISVTSQEERDLLDGVVCEARILKALCYFNLLRLFAPDYADGPDRDGIVLKDHVKMEALPRSSIEQCVTAIRRLLQQALDADHQPTDASWLSQQAAWYLMAELELYAGNYHAAATYAGYIIDAKGYDVLGPATYNTLWNGSTCDERIFMYNNPKTTGSYYVGIEADNLRLGYDYFTVNNTLEQSYSDEDIRKDWSIYPVTNSTGENLPLFGKYNRLRKTKQEIGLINKLRLSGACFIQAEAWCLDGIHHDDARRAINLYLEQRGAEQLSDNITGEQLLQIILQEKQKEFVGEGQRYFDLKRYRRTVLSNWKNSQPSDRRIQADDYRWTWPIPKEEYLYNDNISQNDGWPKQNYH